MGLFILSYRVMGPSAPHPVSPEGFYELSRGLKPRLNRFSAPGFQLPIPLRFRSFILYSGSKRALKCLSNSGA